MKYLTTKQEGIITSINSILDVKMNTSSKELEGLLIYELMEWLEELTKQDMQEMIDFLQDIRNGENERQRQLRREFFTLDLLMLLGEELERLEEEREDK